MGLSKGYKMHILIVKIHNPISSYERLNARNYQI